VKGSAVNAILLFALFEGKRKKTVIGAEPMTATRSEEL
jgi:hypothetical protein